MNQSSAMLGVINQAVRMTYRTRLLLNQKENPSFLAALHTSWSSLANYNMDYVHSNKLPSSLMQPTFQHLNIKLAQNYSCTCTGFLCGRCGLSLANDNARLCNKTGSVQHRQGLNLWYSRSPVFCQILRNISEDRKTTALTIWTGLVHLKSSPLPALVLGFSGLVPFILAPAYMIATQFYLPDVVFAHVTYAAVILSFLGGVRWGFTLPKESTERADWKNLGYSVVPSLVAWTGLLFPLSVSLLTVMGGLAGAAYFDTIMQGYPPWFKALRFTLTFIAVLSLWTSFVCRFLLKKAENKEN